MMKIPRSKINNIFTIFTWIFIMSLVLGVSLHTLVLILDANWQSIFSTNRQAQDWIIFILLFFIGYFVYNRFVYFIFKPFRELSKQKIHGQQSWFYYYYIGLILSPLWVTLFALPCFRKYNLFFYGYSALNIPPLTYIFSSILISVMGLILYFFYHQKYEQQVFKFASGSVDKNSDELDYDDSAKNASLAIMDLTDYVNVVTLYGGLGQGKSSFTRMMIENIDSEKILYTYISLTETNEARDFSKRFSESWIETLGERYPKVSYTNAEETMSSILREMGHGNLFGIWKSATSITNKGLLRTKAKIRDQHTENNKFVSKEVAKLFGNISEIKEVAWIIVIDEIERAQFEEIHKVIEIIERFKLEGRSGLPVKIVFFLCMSREDVEKYIDTYLHQNELSYLIKNYFVDNPKNITRTIYLPIISFDKKKLFVFNALDRIVKYNGIKNWFAVDMLDPNSLFQSDKQNIDDKESIEFALTLLMQESPRTVQRVAQQVEYVVYAFRNSEGIRMKDDYIRFGDIIIAAYVQVKYPFLIEFFRSTLSKFLQVPFDGKLYLDRDKFKENNKTIFDWIAEESGHKVESSFDKVHIENILGVIGRFYIDHVKHNIPEREPLWRQNSLSTEENLRDFLNSTAKESTNIRRINYELFIKHRAQNEQKVIADKDNETLIDYARFLRNATDVPIELNMQMAKEIEERLESNKVKIVNDSIRDTQYINATYEFMFNLLDVIEKKSQNKNIYKHAATELLLKLLRSEKIRTHAKFMLLSNFINKSGGSDNMHFRLIQAFKDIEVIKEKEMREAITHVINESDERYFQGTDDIYQNEENHFYVLYQRWDGNPENSVLINNIRSAALRDLDRHPDAIKMYWNSIYYEDGMDNEDPMFYFHLTNSANLELYMPIENLVSITKKVKFNDEFLKRKISYWTQFVDDPEKFKSYKEKMRLKSATDTLVYALNNSGYL